MAVYLMPKTRLLSKAVNFKPLPTKWSTKWTVVQRSIYSGRQHQQQHQQQSTNQQQSSHHTHHQQQAKAAGGWLTWRGVFLRWTPIGICMVAAAQWHLHNRELDKKGLPRTAARWQAKIYCSLPLRMMSRCWGWVAERRVPKPARPMVYGLYSSTFGVKLEEASPPDFKEYKSLAEFFTRPLKDDVRVIDPKSCIVAPCDGRILHFGAATNNLIEQVKGVCYSLEAFLGPPTWCNTGDCPDMYEKIKKKPSPDSILYQCVIYLAPGDYHRFHSPTVWKPELRRHFAGELLSVSPSIAQWIPGLFCLNERALYVGKWKHGFFSFTAVGATNVGSVQIYMDEKLKTNRWVGMTCGSQKAKEFDELELPQDKFLEKGELLGQFNMGSTVVLIFEAPKEFKFNLFPGQRVKLGEKLGCFEGTEEEEPEDAAEVKRVIEAL